MKYFLKALTPFTLLILSLGLIGCKTTAQVEQEQKVQGISGQLVEGQKLQAELLQRMQNMEQKLAALNGKIEELEHYSMPGEKEDIKSRQGEFEERISLMEKNLQLVRQEIEASRAFMETVTKSLQNLGTNPTPKNDVKKKSESAPTVKELFKKGQYEQAKKIYEAMIAENKTKGKALAETYHNLGIIYFKQKKYEEAMVLFGKLYKEFPLNNYNQNGLLHLAKSLIQTQATDKAKSALQLVIEKFPNSSASKEAQKLLSDLK